jgi:predicted DNA-binding transcriptional regulator AlpA
MDTVELLGELYERADALKSRLGIGDVTLWRFENQGMPRPLKIGRWRFFPRKEVDKWLLGRNPE